MKEVFIIGGGVAGLCAACRLADLGMKPLLLESGKYPTHRICGEFFSPECLPKIKAWGITPSISIQAASFVTATDSFNFHFPQSAGGMSHIEFDPLLVNYARDHGAVIRTKVKVESLICPTDSQGFYTISLNDGQTLTAKSLIIATGRIPNYQALPKMEYMGIKAHFEGFMLQNGLEMFSFPGAYFGIGQIAPHKVNIAGIVHKHCFDAVGSAQALISVLRKQNPIFDHYFATGRLLFDDWMISPVPTFGVRRTPAWPNAYFIGDAAGTIPPACGGGLSMAIEAGCLAAEYVSKGDAISFKKEWQVRFAPKIRWGKIFHSAMMKPTAMNLLIKASRHCKIIPQLIYKATR